MKLGYSYQYHETTLFDLPFPNRPLMQSNLFCVVILWSSQVVSTIWDIFLTTDSMQNFGSTVLNLYATLYNTLWLLHVIPEMDGDNTASCLSSGMFTLFHFCMEQRIVVRILIDYVRNMLRWFICLSFLDLNELFLPSDVMDTNLYIVHNLHEQL